MPNQTLILPRAAMEPADGRRGDYSVSVVNLKYSWPQWSPPMVGGVTVALAELGAGLHVAAMEPADGRRGDLTRDGATHVVIAPQWSPPMVGGVTF